MTVRKEKSVKPFINGCDVTGANLQNLNPIIGSWADVGDLPPTPSYNYGEVLQGNINDCYFLAALSAVAWGGFNPTKLSNYPNYKFYKIKTINPVTVETQTITLDGATPQHVPVDSAGKPLYAQKPSTSDIWVLLYEKAYAKFMDPLQPSNPNYAFIDGGNGWRALISITGLTSGGEYYPGTETENTILTNLGLSTATPSQTVVSNKAAVAWTKSQVMPDTSLYASHTYSILGSYIPASGVKYLVLRNPYGNQTGAQILNPEPSTSVSRDTINWANRGIYLNDTTDGIFAYNLADFKLNFAKYAIVRG
jgi:hypothetical protein